MIVHLNGWPGVGKETIGRILAGRLQARFIPNHLLHDVAIVCTGVGDPERWSLYEEVREAAYARLRRRPRNETFVMTNALCVGRQREVEAWNHVVDLAIARGCALVPVILTAGFEESLRRLQSPSRMGRKMTDAAALQAALQSDAIQAPRVAETAVIDVTTKAPEEAADVILQHLLALGGDERLRPATAQHRVLGV